MRNYALILLIVSSITACSGKATQQPVAASAAETSAAPVSPATGETPTQAEAKPKQKKKKFDQRDYEK